MSMIPEQGDRDGKGAQLPAQVDDIEQQQQQGHQGQTDFCYIANLPQYGKSNQKQVYGDDNDDDDETEEEISVAAGAAKGPTVKAHMVINGKGQDDNQPGDSDQGVPVHPHRLRRRHGRRYHVACAAACCILFVAIGVAIGLGIALRPSSNKSSRGSTSNDADADAAGVPSPTTPSSPSSSDPAPQPAPTAEVPVPSPSPPDRETALRAFLAQHIPQDLLQQPDTPQSYAADWIVHKDPLQLHINAPSLLRRYLLTYFYYHWSALGTQPWTMCNPARDDDHDNVDVDVDDTPCDGNRWLSADDECTWYGIHCDIDEGQLGEISLPQMNLVGTIPTEIGLLSTLRILDLSENLLQGPIPTEMGSLSNVWYLVLDQNHNLDGPIPEELYDMTSLVYLTLQNVPVSGTISTRIGKLTNLDLLFLTDNQFADATLPSELGLLNKLTSLAIRNNKGGIQGTIPEELYTNLSSNLSYLDFSSMSLSGTLSTLIGSMKSMAHFNVNDNPLTGTIPTEIANAPIVSFQVNRNLMIGSMPGEICNRVAAAWGGDGVSTDCLPLDNPTVPCTCCTVCCDRETGECLEQ